MNVGQLVRADIAGLEEYQSVTPPEMLARELGLDPARIVKLDANENPYGPSPMVAAAVRQARFDIYPDPLHTELREKIAPHIGQTTDRIMFGNGSDELLELMIRLLIEPGDEVISCGPTFGMYAFLPPLFMGRVVEVPRRADFSVDPEAVLHSITARTKLILLATPNNPTGNVLPLTDLKNILTSERVVVLDEAYVEFAGEAASAIPLTRDYDNLVVLRTFSKWAGLAGLRVGYGVFPDELIRHLWKIKQPYNVNVAAAAAAIASIDDRETLMENVGRMVAERGRLARGLSNLPGWTVYPSEANFLLCEVPEAAHVQATLRQAGVMVRSYSSPRLANCLRISVGKPADTDRLIEVLK